MTNINFQKTGTVFIVSLNYLKFNNNSTIRASMYNLSLDFIVKEYPCYLTKNNRLVFKGYRYNGLKLKVIEEMTVRKDLHNLYVITDEENIQRAIKAIRKSYIKMLKRLINRLESEKYIPISSPSGIQLLF